MRDKLIKYLKTFHRISLFAVVTIVLMHLLGSEITLSQDIRLSSLILFFISGITLFWIGVITKGAFSKYFRIFIIAPSLIGILMIVNSFAGALLLVTIYKPFESNVIIKETDDIRLTKGNNFMGPCCSYNIYKTESLLFQKRIRTFNVYGIIDKQTVEFTTRDSKTEIKLSYTDIHDKGIVKDTSLTIPRQ